ncbi:MAG TPA: helix-turn-helix transcriptional regulator [Thermoanaerobaculia bacterium]|jgi:transcriptional regulator with XRE-family HTH domain|nr:helix-turn-helix transcriptional regulator [Thermoanaerobaculia bacterium]
MSEPLEKYRRFIHEAQASVDYWADIPISEFGEDVCRLMEEQGVSRAELARRLGTSRAYVTKLLGGNANFTLQTMAKVAMALGAAVHVHVGLKDRVVRWYEEPPSQAAETAGEEAPWKLRKNSG